MNSPSETLRADILELLRHSYNEIAQGEMSPQEIKQMLVNDTDRLIALVSSTKPPRKDLNANFDITADGGIDTPDSHIGVEHALKFAEWTGWNAYESELRQILEGNK